jgi:hypothetical protein
VSRQNPNALRAKGAEKEEEEEEEEYLNIITDNSGTIQKYNFTCCFVWMWNLGLLH